MNILSFLRIVFKGAHPWRRLIAIALKKTKLCYFFLIDMDGYKIIFHPAALSAALWINRGERREDINFLTSYLQQGDLCVDVGANVGTLSLTAAKCVGETGCVKAYEAHPKICKYLEENVQINGFHNVEVFNSAVGEASGEGKISNFSADDQNRITESSEGLSITICALDDVISASSIALIKMDVEGYEYFALKGALETLQVTMCVYIELAGENYDRFGYKASDIFTLLESIGFTLFSQAGSAHLEPLNQGRNFEMVCENIVAIRDIRDFSKRTRWSIDL